MAKNNFKFKKMTNLPFFDTVQKGDSLFTTLQFLKNLRYFGNWGSSLPKPSVFFSNYRVRAKTSLTTNWKQLKNKQLVIGLFPFIFSFSLLIQSRYKEQLFSYFVKDSLPGFCLPRQNLSWETFREITSEKMAYLFDDKWYTYKSSKTGASETGTSESKKTFNNVNMLEDSARIVKKEFPINSFVSKVDSQEKQTNLQNQDLIKRLDIYSNLILLEMKSAWEEKQKDLYIGFLPKEKKITLNKLPALLPLFDDRRNTTFSGVKGSYEKQKVAEKTFNRSSTLSLQTKNNKSKTLFYYKFYARKPNFLSFYKGGIELKPTQVNIKPTLINVFSKQLFQQKLFDLDELPSKLDQNYSEALFSKTEEDQKYLSIPSPNLFGNSQIFQNRKFVSNLLDFYSNQGKGISNMEKSITSQKFESNLLNPSLPLPFFPFFPEGKEQERMENLEKTSSDDKMPVVTKSISKKSFLENEVKNFFYNEGFLPFKNLQKYRNQLADLDLTSSFIIPGSRQFVNFISDFSNPLVLLEVEEPSSCLNDVKEFDFFDSIQTLILNLEKNKINLTLPEQSFITQSRLLSGYLYPDMDVAKIRTLLIQNVYKNTIFQKLNKECFPIKIEVPSSFIDDLLTENDYLTSTSLEPLKSPSPLISLRSLTSLTSPKVMSVMSVMLEGENLEGLEPLKQSKPVFSFLTNLEVKFHYLPASQTLLNQNLPENFNIGGIYQNTLTIYKNSKTEKKSFHPNFDRNLQFVKKNRNKFLLLSDTFFGKKSKESNVFSSNLKPVKNLLSFFKPFLYFQKPFRESWEPVTVQSWLVITKLSFLFIALKIFQSLLLNYGKYLFFLDFLDENLKEEFGLTDKKKDKGYRLVKKVKKRFKDIAGIDNILPELGEMVWVLRNSGRSFKVGNLLPKGFLFVGPPGTGKTLLVQAIAGEAEVPVLVQSGSSLTDAEENEEGAQRLKNLFEQARKMAPCIVFIDEMDTLGESRQNVMRNSVETDDLIQSLYNSNQELPEKSWINIGKPGSIAEKQGRGGVTRNENLQRASYSSDITDILTSPKVMLKGDVSDVSDVRKKNEAKEEANQEQLTLLMQFLVELDGLKSRTGVIVIGATNRPKVLDPALTRPGRFDRLLNLEFPGKRKRIEILKLYSQNIGLTFPSPTISLTSNKNSVFPLSNEKKETNIPTDFSVTNLLGRTKDRSNSFFSFSNITDILTSLTSLTSPFNITFGDVKMLVMSVMLKGYVSDVKEIKEKKINENPDFPWEYLANRSFGFSAADLAAAMNQSALQAIIQKTGHTIETIDQGIEVITSYNIEKPKIDSEKQKDPFLITRFAYFQAGKAVLHTLLPQHPDAILLKLWPRPKNNRHKNGNLQLTSINHRTKLETHLIGLYAGKAAELLALCLNSHTKKDNISRKKRKTKIKEKRLPNSKSIYIGNSFRKGYASSNKNKVLDLLANPFKIGDFNTVGDGFFQKSKERQDSNFSPYDKRNLSHSNLGMEDLSIASQLAHSLVDKWYFYSNKVVIRRENQIFINQNQLETSEIEVFELFQQLTEDIQNRVSTSNISESNVGEHSRYNFQELSIRPWWQNQITKQTGAEPYKNEVFVRNLNIFYDDWYRIYLPDPEESPRNEEWVTPDEYYHNTQNLKSLLPIPSFNKKDKSSNKKDKSSSYLLPTFKDLIKGKFLATFKSELEAKDCKQKNHILTVQPNLNSKISKEKYQLFVKNLIFKNCLSFPREKIQKDKFYFDITWNDLYKLDRDYIYHGLVLTCFNKAFSLLDENRELLDYLTDYLICFETLQQQKIKEIFYDFGYFSSSNVEDKSFLKNQQTIFASKEELQPSLSRDQLKILKDKQKISFIFDKKWGKNSRRYFSRFFNFNQQPFDTKKVNKKIYARPFTFLKRLPNKN